MFPAAIERELKNVVSFGLMIPFVLEMYAVKRSMRIGMESKTESDAS